MKEIFSKRFTIVFISLIVLIIAAYLLVNLPINEKYGVIGIVTEIDSYSQKILVSENDTGDVWFSITEDTLIRCWIRQSLSFDDIVVGAKVGVNSRYMLLSSPALARAEAIMVY